MISRRSFLGTVAAPSFAAACAAPGVHRLLRQAQRDPRSPAENAADHARRLSEAMHVDWPGASWLSDVDAFFYAARQVLSFVDIPAALQIGGSLVLAGLVLVLLVVVGIWRGGNAPEADPLAALRESSLDASVASSIDTSALEAALGISLANVRGNPAAPVSIVEYGDFGCPACRAWHNAGVLEQLEATYGDQISFTFRHFPVITLQSPKAAEAAQCAAEQERFWEYHDYLYEVANGRLGDEDLKQSAEAVGLDGQAFGECLDSGKHQDYVANDFNAAREAGARGTPTFLINGQQVNPQPEAMIAAVETVLAQQ